MEPDRKDLDALRREKYRGDPAADMGADIERLRKGEPLAYVIGSQPFLGLSLDLSSHPLIPRPETEWWTELLVTRIGDAPLRVLDLCAGSGAIGLAVLKHCPNVHVSFGELKEEHAKLIQKNLEVNDLDASRSEVRSGDLFAPFAGEQFDVIATNPPYIPTLRTLPESVTCYEPPEALFGGVDGLSIIERILEAAPTHLRDGGEVWMECDVSNTDAARELAFTHEAMRSDIRTDLYGRSRLLVAYW